MKFSAFLLLFFVSFISIGQKRSIISRESSKMIMETLGEVDSLMIFEEKGLYQLKVMSFWYAAPNAIDGLNIMQDFYIRIMEQDTVRNEINFGHFWLKGKFIEPENFTFDGKDRILSFDHFLDEKRVPVRFKIRVADIEKVD